MIKSKIKVSIIVPVYNVEQYLRQCLDSLIFQTLKNIEIICVDDGSTDWSSRILREYQEKDERIVVITQDNRGQSSARNQGLKEAKGEYIGFLDSDDWAEPTMFEKLYNNAKCFDSDISICSINVYDELNKSFRKNDTYLSLNIFPNRLFGKAFSYKDCDDLIFRIPVTPWNKIYRRTFLKTKNITFVQNLNFEDTIFSPETLILANKISLVDEKLINYRLASQTSYSAWQDAKKLDFFKVFFEIKKMLFKAGKLGEFKYYFEFHKKQTLIYWYDKIKNRKVKKQYKKLLIKAYPSLKYYPLSNIFRASKCAKNVRKISKNKRVAIWGTYDFVQKTLQKIKSKNIVGIIDDAGINVGKKMCNYNVYSVEQIPELDLDYIVTITKTYYKFENIVKTSLLEKGINSETMGIYY